MYRLSRDVMAIRIASIIRFIEIILLRMSHLGINPVSGGRPLSERMVIDRAKVSWGVDVHMLPRSLIVVEVVLCSKIKIGVVVVV